MPLIWPKLLALFSSAIAVSAGTLRLRGYPGLRGPRRDFGGISRFSIDTGNLDANIWQGQSKANELRLMDDLEPIAPLDRLTQDVSPEVPSYEDLTAPVPTGSGFDPVFVPPYLFPDAFPFVGGSTCLCGPKGTAPAFKKLLPGQQQVKNVQQHLTAEELEALYRAYGKENVKKLLADAQATADHHHCDCGKEENGAYRYVKASPVYNSSKYFLEPVDATYGDGHYWLPRPKDGIVAPAERLPLQGYPLQADADEMQLLPPAAIEDRVGTRFARYIDQVEARSRECDTVSEECTTKCAPGDKVILTLGSTQVPAQVVSAHVGNALQVIFTPAAAKGQESGTQCGIEAGCTVFRPCHANDGTGCVEEEDVHSKDFSGTLRTVLQCPAGTTICRTVKQLIDGTFMRKAGRACRAVG